MTELEQLALDSARKHSNDPCDWNHFEPGFIAGFKAARAMAVLAAEKYDLGFHSPYEYSENLAGIIVQIGESEVPSEG